jgi:hypothetical protein
MHVILLIIPYIKPKLTRIAVLFRIGTPQHQKIALIIHQQVLLLELMLIILIDLAVDAGRYALLHTLPTEPMAVFVFDGVKEQAAAELALVGGDVGQARRQKLEVEAGFAEGFALGGGV